MRPLPSSKHDADDQADEVLVAVCVDANGREAVFPAGDIELRPGEGHSPTVGPVHVVSDTPSVNYPGGTIDSWNTRTIVFERREVDGGN